MFAALSTILLTASIDGGAALGHASALSALGPHPWGSPRTSAAALYVAAEFRDAGLQEVRTVRVEEAGVHGSNVIGVLRSGGSETVVLASRHDTEPASPGAWSSGGGVGVLIETARSLASVSRQSRDIVFVSFDGGAIGARAWASSLGPGAKNIVGILVLQGAGWAGGRPVLHASTYREVSVRAGRVTAPAGLVDSILGGMRRAGASPVLGDPLVSWISQPSARLFEMDFEACDRTLLQSGLPAVLLTETSVAAPFPWAGSLDTPNRLDAAALERMGRAAIGALDGMGDASLSRETSMEWFSGAGEVWGPVTLGTAGALTMAPALVAALRSGGLTLGLRIVHAAVFAIAALRMPTLALFLLGLPNLTALFGSFRRRSLGLVPLGAILVFVALAARQGVVRVFLPSVADAAVLLVGLALALAPLARGAAKRRGGPKPGAKGRRKGLSGR